MLLELNASLKPGGVLFSSNPRGHNEEGWIGGCYGVYHERPDTVVRRCRKGPSAPTGRGEPDVQPVHRAGDPDSVRLTPSFDGNRGAIRGVIEGQGAPAVTGHL